MLLKTIAKGHILFNSSTPEKDIASYIKNLIQKKYEDYFNKEEFTEDYKEYKDLDDVLSVLGLEVENAPYSQTYPMVYFSLCTTQKDFLAELLSNLYKNRIVGSYGFKCWEGPLGTEIYTLSQDYPDWQVEPIPLYRSILYAGGKKDRDITDFYIQDSTTVLSKESKGELIKSDWTLKDIISELESPWTPGDISYTIYPNLTLFPFKCIKTMHIYDGVDFCAFGYGFTPTDALQNCIDRIEWLKEQAMIKYNFNPVINIY